MARGLINKTVEDLSIIHGKLVSARQAASKCVSAIQVEIGVEYAVLIFALRSCGPYRLDRPPTPGTTERVFQAHYL